MENSTLTMLRQRLEILYQMVNKLEKEESSTTSYTKEEIDALLNGKADKLDTYTKQETNSQIETQVNSKIAADFPILSSEEYEALTPEQKTARTYYIYD